MLVLSPLGGRSLTPPEWGMHLATQIDELRAGGSRVEIVFPDSDSTSICSAPNAMDVSLRPPPPAPGTSRARPSPRQLTEFWS